MICGGVMSERVECLDITSSKVVASPATVSCSEKGALCGGDQIITFGKSVVKTLLKSPFSFETAGV